MQKFALICLLFLLFFCISSNAQSAPPPPAGQLISARGQVDIFLPSSINWHKAVPGMVLAHGAMIRTGENGTASLLIADETLIKLNRNTKFTIKEASAKAGWNRLRGIMPASATGSKTRVGLEGGEAWFLNKNQDTNFEVETSTVTATIRGTEFNAKMTPDATVHVAVMEGHVLVENDFGNLTLAAGEEAVTTPGSAPIRQVLLRPADAVQWTIILPSLFTPRDLKLVSQDKNFLDQEVKRLKNTDNNPASIEDAVHLGLIYRDRGDAKQAEKLLKEANERDPASDIAIAGLGWLLLDKNQFAQAVEIFTKAKENTPLGLAGLSIGLIHLNKLQEAQDLLAKTVASFPNEPLLQISTISLQISRGEVRGAAESLLTLTKQYPNFAGAWELHALTSLVLDDQETARIAINKAKTLLPDSPTPLIISAYIDQAAFNLSQGAKELQQALGLENDNITATIALARIEFGSGNIPKAKDLLAKSQKLSPENPEILNLMGFIDLAQRNKSAKQLFAKAIDLAPRMAEPRLGEALCQMRAGDEAGALEQISTAVLLNPRRAIFRS